MVSVSLALVLGEKVWISGDDANRMVFLGVGDALMLGDGCCGFVLGLVVIWVLVVSEGCCGIVHKLVSEDSGSCLKVMSSCTTDLRLMGLSGDSFW